MRGKREGTDVLFSLKVRLRLLGELAPTCDTASEAAACLHERKRRARVAGVGEEAGRLLPALCTIHHLKPYLLPSCSHVLAKRLDEQPSAKLFNYVRSSTLLTCSSSKTC